MLCIGLASKLDMMSQIILAGLPLKIRFSMSTWCYECKKPSSLQVSKKYCTPHSRNKRKNMFFDQRDFRINNTTCREAPSDKCFKTNLLSKATFSSVCISAYCKQKICLECVSFNLRNVISIASRIMRQPVCSWLIWGEGFHFSINSVTAVHCVWLLIEITKRCIWSHLSGMCLWVYFDSYLKWQISG